MQEFGIPLWALFILAFALFLLFTDIGKAYTFSEMRLEITYKGLPAADARVIRTIHWQRNRVDEFIADTDGRVILPPVRQRSLAQFFPLEFVVAQVLEVEFDNQKFEVWINSKRNPSKNSELGGMGLNVVCELTDTERLVKDFNTLFVTNCRWNALDE